jgi:hypothetical protein
MSQNRNLNNRLFSIKDCEGLPPRRRLKGDWLLLLRGVTPCTGESGESS